jgi:hypothetical protein
VEVGRECIRPSSGDGDVTGGDGDVTGGNGGEVGAESRRRPLAGEAGVNARDDCFVKVVRVSGALVRLGAVGHLWRCTAPSWFQAEGTSTGGVKGHSRTLAQARVLSSGGERCFAPAAEPGSARLSHGGSGVTRRKQDQKRRLLKP